MNEIVRTCPKCGSDEVVKGGKHYCQKGVVQRYQCKVCGASFSHDGYFRGKHPLSVLQYAMALYGQGKSYEKIVDKLKKNFGIRVSRGTIGKWMVKFQVKPRKTSGDQKNKIVRELIEIGVVTTVRFASSEVPEKFLVLGNSVIRS